jgi:hypothetical protein
MSLMSRKNRLIEKEVEQHQTTISRHQQQLIVDVYGGASEVREIYYFAKRLILSTNIIIRSASIASDNDILYLTFC